MARENQGLQFTLIGFVLLTILLAVLTFVFFSQSKELTAKLTEAQNAARTAQEALTSAQADLNSLKTDIGFAEGMDVNAVRGEIKKDMEAYGAAYMAENKRYHQLVQNLFKAKEEADLKLAAERKTSQGLTVKLMAVEDLKQREIAPLKADVERVAQEKASEVAAAAQVRDQYKSKNDELVANLGQQKEAAATEAKDLQAKIKVAEDRAIQKSKEYQLVKAKIEEITKPNPDKFQGEVEYVSHQNRVVWINLGWADSLRPQTNFAIYPAEANDVTPVGRKGSIEVTEVVDAHLAKARILDDRASDPILPRDRLFTAIWNPGDRRHFALTGSFDLDKDGQTDLERIHTLIELNGGVVDARQGADGKRQGKLDMNTRFLIIGDEPGASSSPDALKDHTAMITQANEYKVEKINLAQFLDMVGWKPEVDVNHFGGTGSTNMAPRPRDQVQQPGGPISESFKPRKAPRSSGGSAY